MKRWLDFLGKNDVNKKKVKNFFSLLKYQEFETINIIIDLRNKIKLLKVFFVILNEKKLIET